MLAVFVVHIVLMYPKNHHLIKFYTDRKHMFVNCLFNYFLLAGAIGKLF